MTDIKSGMERGKELVDRLDSLFEECYQLDVKSGHLPIEFAGKEGKDILYSYYRRGSATAMLELVLERLKSSQEPKP